MKMTRWKMWTSTTAMLGTLALLQMPAQGGVVSYFSDNFSMANIGESQTGSLDPGGFSVITSNVDVIGNDSTVPAGLGVFEGICGTVPANCVDLDGTGGTNDQGAVESTALVLSAGTYSLNYDLLGASGYLTGIFRNITTETTVLLGTSACISSHTGCLYSNNVTLAGTDVTSGSVSTSVVVGTGGTYYLAFVSDTSGVIGSLLDSASLTGNAIDPVVPEPSTMVLLGSALLGLGGLGRLRARKSR